MTKPVPFQENAKKYSEKPIKRESIYVYLENQTMISKFRSEVYSRLFNYLLDIWLNLIYHYYMKKDFFSQEVNSDRGNYQKPGRGRI